MFRHLPFHQLAVRHILYLLLIFSVILSSCAKTRILAEASATRFSVKQNSDYSSLIERNLKAGYGFSAGAMVEIFPDALTFAIRNKGSEKKISSISLMAGLKFIQKGYIRDFAPGYRTSVYTNYIELPVSVLFSYPLGGGNLFGGGGVYFAEGVGGVSKFKAPGTYYEYMSFGDIIRTARFDAGVNFQCGYTFSPGVSLAAVYDMGLRNTATAGVIAIYNRTLCFTVRYDLSGSLKMNKKKR